MMVSGRREAEMMYFTTPYRVSVIAVGRCDVNLGGERMEEVKY